MTQQKTQIVLINSNSDTVWAAGRTVEEAKAECELHAGERLVWEEITRRDYEWEHAEKWTKFQVLEVPAGEWSAQDTEQAREVGEIVAYLRCADITDVGAE